MRSPRAWTVSCGTCRSCPRPTPPSSRSTPAAPDGLHVLRHSAAHVLAQAVCELFPGTHYAIGPAIEDGFYYDLELPEPLSAGDLNRIEQKMREIVKQDQPFVREELTRAEALERFADQPFKREIIESLEPGEVRRRRHGQRVPQQRLGRPVPRAARAVDPQARRASSSRTSPARTGAATSGTSSSPASTARRGPPRRTSTHTCTGSRRPSGATTAGWAPSSTCSASPTRSGSGLAVFHPRGGLVRKLMEDYSRQRHEEAGYEFVNTPHITKSELFETSRPPGVVRRRDVPADGARRRRAVLPEAHELPDARPDLQSQPHSYRELPLRLFEFGTVYRYEKSGTIHGLSASAA